MSSIQAHPAAINQKASIARVVQNMKRDKIAIASLTKQLQTPFRSEAGKRAAEVKLEKLMAKISETEKTLRAAQTELNEALKSTEATESA